jgi:hypothetical protein
MYPDCLGIRLSGNTEWGSLEHNKNQANRPEVLLLEVLNDVLFQIAHFLFANG